QEDITIIQKSISNHQMIRFLKIYQHRGVDTPFVIGIIRPIIVFPCKKWSETDLELALRHEIIHICQWDNFIKVLAISALALNFYNPLVWYILYQWNLIAELSCDNKVIAGRTKEEIKQYGMLIINMAEDKPNSVGLPLMGFNVQNKIMKERIYQMKRGTKKENMFKKVLGASIMGVALFSSSLSVLAYSPKSVIHLEAIADKIIISDESIDMWGNDLYKDLPVNENGGWIFWDDEGEIIDVQDGFNIDAEVHSTCKHEYKDYKATVHYKYSDNSCKIEYYEAQKCSKCGNLKLGDLISTATYVSCPH
ncbi:MAG: M56 family metallopeptidase, partial [Lachnospiraceae bacterium]|nr:M56 family metallopeptidase [Lachnospiraceae bacterium]